MAKFHEKNQAVYFGIQTAEKGGVGTTFGSSLGTIAAPAVTGTAGQFSCTADTLYIGLEIVITGTNTGTSTGVTAGTYFIIATNGTTTFTLSATRGGTALVTTAGTIVGATLTKVGLASTKAIACTEITADPTRDTGSFQFLGDALSRDEFTYVKDTYVDLSVSTFQQVVDTTATVIDPDQASIWKMFQVCGGNVVADATTKEVFVDNATESPDFGTAHVRLATPDDVTNDKMYLFSDLRGTVDVDASLGDVPKLKFSLKGNTFDPVATPKQTASFGTQTTAVAPSVLFSTVKVAQLINISDTETFAATGLTGNTGLAIANTGARCTVTLTSHDIPVGTLRRIRVASASNALMNGDFVAYALTTTKLQFYVKGVTGSAGATGATITKGQTYAPATFCFSTLTASNFFGFDYQRFLTGCDQGFAKGATPTDVAVTMLEDQVGSSAFNPDTNITKFFAGIIKFGNSVGSVSYMWDKLQIANVKQGKVATYLGRDVSFRNTGSSFIFYQA